MKCVMWLVSSHQTPQQRTHVPCSVMLFIRMHVLKYFLSRNLTSVSSCCEQRLNMWCGMSAAIRLPSGGRLQRTFSKEDPVSALHDFCIVKVYKHMNVLIES